MTAVFLRSWGCRLLKGGVGWRGGAGIFRFPPKLTVSHFQMEVEDFFYSASRMVFGGGVLVGTYKRRLEKINRKPNLWDPVCNKDSY